MHQQTQRESFSCKMGYVIRFCHAYNKKVSERNILLNRKHFLTRFLNIFLTHPIWEVLIESLKYIKAFVNE